MSFKACHLTKLTNSILGVNMISMLKTVIDSFVNIVYPTICVSCKNPNYLQENEGHLCNWCYAKIQRHIPPLCFKCGRGLKNAQSIHQGICVGCLNKQYSFHRAYSVCVYDGIIKDLIHRFKYNQKLQYKIVFENLFKEFLENFNILREIDLIIPVPLHPVKLREREYNQSQILAVAVSQILNKPVACDILLRSRNTKSQIDLNEEKRIKNITGCFSIKNGGRLESKSLLLIDDVLTTGITLSEAAGALREYGPREISVLTLAS